MGGSRTFVRSVPGIEEQRPMNFVNPTVSFGNLQLVEARRIYGEDILSLQIGPDSLFPISFEFLLPRICFVPFSGHFSNRPPPASPSSRSFSMQINSFTRDFPHAHPPSRCLGLFSASSNSSTIRRKRVAFLLPVSRSLLQYSFS